jgi:non-heme chloroperoxidase
MVNTIQSVALGNDLTLEYAEQGDPGGIPVVCLHGVTDSYRSFDPVLPLLPKSFRVFAISQRGHGHSSRPLSGYRYADLADDVHRFMGLVLAGAFLTIRGDATIEEFWTTTLATMTDPIDRRIAEDFQLSTLAMPVSQAFFDMVVGESLKVPAHVWRATFSEFRATDFSNELTRITAPTLMVWGDQDLYCGQPHWEGLRRAIPHAQVRLYGGHGHALHWEAPDRFARDVVSFVHQHCLHHAL